MEKLRSILLYQNLICNVRHCRMYSTASSTQSLSKLFNYPDSKFNFFFNNRTGLFGIPELCSFEGFYALRERTKLECDSLIEEIYNSDRKKNLVPLFDQLSNSLCCLADLAEFIRTAHPDSSFIVAAEDSCLSMNSIVEKLNTNKRLYTNLKEVLTNGDKYPMTKEDIHVGQLFLFDFELNGIHLEEKKRQYVVDLNNYILITGQRFMIAAEKSRNVDVSKISDTVLKEYVNQNGQIIVKHTNAHSDNPLVREAAFKIFHSPNEESEQLLDNLLECRHKLALTCGFPSYAHSLYNINMVFEDLEPGEGWADRVHKLAVTHNTEGLLGYIYCDFFERPGKLHNDSHYVVRGGRQLTNDSYQVPIVVVMLNVVWRGSHGPVLLHPGTVENLFHEFGHAIHSMLGRTKYQHVNGTRCATDLAEFPSVLMEYYATQPQVIKRYAKHYRTKEPMPDEMLNRLCTSKYLFAASEMQLQLFYSVLDQQYHTNAPQPKSTTNMLAKLQVEYYGLPYVENTAWQLRFSHFVGYGSKYYSYLVSKAIAARTWHEFLSQDPLNNSQGEHLRNECLQHGGGKPARSLVADYLKTSVTPKLLASSLIEDIDQGIELFNMSKDI
ncbi:mitochondrial intermediate peptidase isoform X2 [Adelges cooleyi]|uniref:mitochondrial intermediate peptidase isoform X2 n=1 Tax=Adelges cooleyi TaxID=133065 RepID=UPI00218087BA|nr:mitochondrial intermediate peptidase isoform X2 [Adelges cooleyi]